MIVVLLYAVWIEIALWRTIRRRGNAYDRAVLAGIHLALAAGVAIGLWIQQQGYLIYVMQFVPANLVYTWRDGRDASARLLIARAGFRARPDPTRPRSGRAVGFRRTRHRRGPVRIAGGPTGDGLRAGPIPGRETPQSITEPGPSRVSPSWQLPRSLTQ